MTVKTPSANDQIDLAEYVSAIWRFRFAIIAVTLAACVVAAVVSLRAARVYEASLVLNVSPPKFGDGGTQPVLTPASFRPLLQSPTVAATVIREFHLDQAPYNLTPSDLVSMIEAEEIRGTTLIRLTVTFPDAQLSAKIADRVAELGIALARKMIADEGTGARDLIKQELDESQRAYESADRAVTEFRTRAQIEALRKDVDAALGERATLLTLLVQIESEKAKLSHLETELSKRTRIDSLRRSVLDNAAGDTGVGAKATDSAALRLQSEFVNGVYANLDEAAARSRADLAAMEKRRAELIDKRHIDAAALPSLTALYAREAELARLTADRDLAQKSYLSAAAMYEQARLQVAGRSARLEIIEPAVAPDRPLSRNTARNVALAGLVTLGLLIGAALCIHIVALSQRDV